MLKHFKNLGGREQGPGLEETEIKAGFFYDELPKGPPYWALYTFEVGEGGGVCTVTTSTQPNRLERKKRSFKIHSLVAIMSMNYLYTV